MRSARLLSILTTIAVVLALLSWNHFLPGGWKLRGYLAPHGLRAALNQTEHSFERMQAFAQQGSASEEDRVVFIGSSTIERFPLAESFPGRACVNLGIGSESAAQLLDRLEASLPAGPLAAAILYVGSIDFRERDSSAQRTARLAGAVLSALREEHPRLPLAIIGILPEQDMSAAMVERLRATNDALREMCSQINGAFIDTDRPPLRLPDGSLDPQYASDRLHLNSTGYEVLTGWILEQGQAAAAPLLPDSN